MKRPVAVAAARVLLVGVALSLLPLSCRRRTPSLTELLADRPTPDINNLAERSAVGRTGDDATAAFYDILKLRETRDSEAIPALERILADHAGSLRIHGYAAAQALFCIGMPEAHAILKSRLLSNQYDAYHGINYAFHWDMDEERRDSFIQRYHLVNLSSDLALGLRVESYETSRRWLTCALTIENSSDQPFQILDQMRTPCSPTHLGSLLYFRSAKGRYARTFIKPVRLKEALPPKWVELQPGASHLFRVEIDVRRVNGLRQAYPVLSEDANLVLDARDVGYDIVDAGDFNVYAMFEVTQQTAAQLRTLGCARPWVGRAVSGPVLVEVAEPPQ